MPASLLYDMNMEHINSNGSNNNNIALELPDQRALQLALELSMLGLQNENDSMQNNSYDNESRNGKKSQNTTECVPVPSSEHVAEIVGRQGCKIKALRAKTNTYIKTPVRGEEPVFVVTGRKEDVNAAKREILSAADHFSQIRAQRKNNMSGIAGTGGPGGPSPNANVPGQTTIQVRVPYRVVGLVVGPKGATIKRIQQQTNTYIITPSRDKEPVFEVTGLCDNVDTARKEIEAHIAMRTGGLIDSAGSGSGSGSGNEEDCSEFSNSSHSLINGIENAFSNNGTNQTNGFSSLYNKSDPFSVFSSNRDGANLLLNRSNANTNDIFNFTNNGTNGKMNDIYSSFSNGISKCFGSFETDEGIGDSPTFDSLNGVTNTSSSLWPDFSQTQRPFSSVIIGSNMERRSSSLESSCSTTNKSSSDANSSSVDSLLESHAPARRQSSDPLSSQAPFVTCTVTSTSNGAAFARASSESTSSTTNSSSSPVESLGSIGSIGNGRASLKQRECILCFEGNIVAALVPCGHNMFCMDCAVRVCGKPEPECPVCHQNVSQAIRIFN